MKNSRSSALHALPAVGNPIAPVVPIRPDPPAEPPASHGKKLICDYCHKLPAIGYTSQWEYPDSLSVYCEDCSKDVPGIILFE